MGVLKLLRHGNKTKQLRIMALEENGKAVNCNNPDIMISGWWSGVQKEIETGGQAELLISSA